jgi:hypothetical protein
MTATRFLSSIEPLEARIAPAGLVAPTFVSPTKVIYTGPDGSLVTVTSSKPAFSSSNFTSQFIFSAANALGGYQLEELNISSLVAANETSLSITAAPQKDTSTGSLVGSGFVNVGTINASGIDLDSVTVHGDLTQILVGVPVTATTKTVGISSLSVLSMGVYGTSLETATVVAGKNPGPLESDIKGGIKTMSVAGDMDGVWIRVTGFTDGSFGTIGTMTVGGNLVGESGANTGEITASATIGTLTIKGSVIGGGGMDSGRIAATKVSKTATAGAANSITIGELVGGGAQDSGEILLAGGGGSIKVLHDVYATASSAASSGRIESDGNLTSLSIGGSLIGAAHSNTGQILITGTAGKITIGGDILGGSNGTAGTITDSGYVEVDGALASITVGGSIVSGQKNSTGALTNSGDIRSLDTIGSITVAGSLLGNSTVPVEISAEGTAGSALPKIDTIGSVSVSGTVDYANILAGYDNTDTAKFGDVVIGKITVAGDWEASNAIAGFTAGAGKLFNGSTDAPIGGATSAIISKIASVVIGGEISGTLPSVSSTDAYAFEAESIGSFKTGGATIAVGTTPTEITLSPETGGDVFINTQQSGA